GWVSMENAQLVESELHTQRNAPMGKRNTG
ncbi:hypothetical protein L195_g048357, partial [Trifolium pratense]